ncbi:MAG TPA: radical SAM protein, partial [Spirochaetota bacterium]|nr:radical SAM protein [Spirochaetota bacterium]
MFQNFKKYIRNRQLLQDQRRFEEEFYKKAIVSYPPRHVTIGVTSFCNNNCVFCAYHSLDAKDSSNVYGLNFNLSFDDFTRIIDMCYRGRVPDTHICGTGEPFINKDILKMIDYSIKRYGKASVQTNFHRPIFEKNNYYDELIKRSVHISYITTDVLSGDPDQHNEMKKGSNYEDV